jgi:hypothetical protein
MRVDKDRADALPDPTQFDPAFLYLNKRSEDCRAGVVLISRMGTVM